MQTARTLRWRSSAAPQAALFAPEQELLVARAPGRLDVMGGIADYSGSLVLELPLAQATYVALQAARGDELRIVSVGLAGADSKAERRVSLPLRALSDAARKGYPAAHALLAAHPESAWAAYVAGALVVLEREHGFTCPSGLSLLVTSNVPEGKGVSSSAALEVATLQALSAWLGHPFSGLELAMLAQRVEHAVVGAPCGIMDQVSVTLGRAAHFVELLCQPAEVRGALPIPPSAAFFGVDSGVRHEVKGAEYSQVRGAAFMGYRMIAELENLQVEARGPGRVRVVDPLYRGYLANIPPSLFEQRYAPQLPALLTGAEFLERFRGTADDATEIRPELVYPVLSATRHPVQEHHRTRLFRELLPHAGTSEVAQLLGELMAQAHASYTACGLGSAATDTLVAMARELGPERGLYGAKITGGGSGGTVALLARPEAREQVRELARRYAEEQGRGGSVFEGSSDGAEVFGVRRYASLNGT